MKIGMARGLVALGALVALTALVGAAEPPRGKRRSKPAPTHVVIVETAFTTGGQPATLMPGVPVVASGAVSAAAKKVKVTTMLGGVEVSGTVAGAALGLCAQKDTPLFASDGKTPLGQLRAGALVRVVGPAKGKGLVTVESAGDFVVKGVVARDALAPRPHELVYSFSWSHETAKVTTLWPTQALAGNGMVRLPERVRLEAYEQAGDVYHVRVHGGVELDGWTPAANLTPREAPAAPPPDANLVKATHEVFLDATIYADAAGKKPIGTLRGGARVEVNAKASQNDETAVKAGTWKVTTPAPVIVPGWMKPADLRDLRPQGAEGRKLDPG